MLTNFHGKKEALSYGYIKEFKMEINYPGLFG